MASQLVARERVVPVAERTNPGGFVGRRPSGARNGNAVSSDEETDTSSHEEEETAEGTSRDEDDVRETLDCLVDAATESSGVSDDETDTERTMTDTPGSSESTNASWEVVAPEASASQRKPSTKKKHKTNLRGEKERLVFSGQESNASSTVSPPLLKRGCEDDWCWDDMADAHGGKHQGGDEIREVSSDGETKTRDVESEKKGDDVDEPTRREQKSSVSSSPSSVSTDATDGTLAMRSLEVLMTEGTGKGRKNKDEKDEKDGKRKDAKKKKKKTSSTLVSEIPRRRLRVRLATARYRDLGLAKKECAALAIATELEGCETVAKWNELKGTCCVSPNPADCLLIQKQDWHLLKAVLFRERGGDVEFDVSDEDSFSSSSLFSAFTDGHDRHRSGDFTCTFLAFAKIGKWVRCGCAGMRKQSVRRVTPESAKERHKSQLGEKALRRLLASLAVACFATAGVWANRHGRRTVWRTALIAASLTAVTVKQAVRKHDGI